MFDGTGDDRCDPRSAPCRRQQSLRVRAWISGTDPSSARVFKIDLDVCLTDRGVLELRGELREADDLVAIGRVSRSVEGPDSLVRHMVRGNPCIDQRRRQGPAKISLGRNQSILLVRDEKRSGELLVHSRVDVGVNARAHRRGTKIQVRSSLIETNVAVGSTVFRGVDGDSTGSADDR